jgi:hypothetical protein
MQEIKRLKYSIFHKIVSSCSRQFVALLYNSELFKDENGACLLKNKQFGTIYIEITLCYNKEAQQPGTGPTALGRRQVHTASEPPRPKAPPWRGGLNAARIHRVSAKTRHPSHWGLVPARKGARSQMVAAIGLLCAHFFGGKLSPRRQGLKQRSDPSLCFFRAGPPTQEPLESRRVFDGK